MPAPSLVGLLEEAGRLHPESLARLQTVGLGGMLVASFSMEAITGEQMGAARVAMTALVMAMAMSNTAMAAESLLSESGQAFASYCGLDASGLKIECSTYLGGVAQGFKEFDGILRTVIRMPADAGLIACLPKHLTLGEVDVAVISYLAAHPDQKALPTPALVFAALKESWPCKSGMPATLRPKQ